VLLDQDDCRVNFKVSVNLAKNLLVNFRFKSEAIKFFVLLGFLVKFNKSKAIITSSIVTSSQNTATNTRQAFLIAQIHNPPCFYSLNLAQDTNLLAEFSS